MEFDAIGLDNFQDYVLFIHLLDPAGHTVHQFHIYAWQAMAAGKLNIPFLRDCPTLLSPGEYWLEAGLYNARLEKRVVIDGISLSARDRKKRNFIFGKTTLTE